MDELTVDPFPEAPAATPAAEAPPAEPPAYQHPEGNATIVFKDVVKVLPLWRCTTFGLAEEFGVDLEQFPYLKTQTSVHEPLNEQQGILYGLIDGTEYTLVLGNPQAGKRKARRRQQVALRGVQRLESQQTELTETEENANLLEQFEKSPADELDWDLPVPAEKRRKIDDNGYIPASSSANVHMEALDQIPEKEAEATVLPDDLDADLKLEETIAALNPEEIISRISKEPRVRMAPSEIQLVYEQFRPNQQDCRLAPQPAGLASKLFVYQLAAVAWMVDRECFGLQLAEGIGSSSQLDTPPEARVAGGILADEVGLGKTLETLGLILSHQFVPRNRRNEHSSEPPSISATLIVAPPFLLAQWESEIEKHCGIRMHTFRYEGIEQIRYIMAQKRLEEENAALEEEGKRKRKRAPQISDLDLMEFVNSGHIFDGIDIVLTSYDVMRNEFHLDGNNQRVLRGRTVVRALSPLRSVRWWRVCMDEVQEIKGAQSQAARMCRDIPAVNRWGISGTPIKHSFYDIFGLLVFLGVDESLWELEPKEIINRLRRLMWRHSQLHVMDHLNIPPVQETVIDVYRTPLEVYCRRKIEAKFPDLGPAFWSKFDSAPFDVTYSTIVLRPGQRRGLNPPDTIDFDFLWTSLVNICTSELRTLHAKLASGIIDLAVHLYHSHKAGRADVGVLTEARKLLEHALEISTYCQDTEYFDLFVKLDVPGFQIDTTPTEPLQLATLRAYAAHSAVCRDLGDTDSALASQKEIDSEKDKFLSGAFSNWNRAVAKFKRVKSETGLLRRNRTVEIEHRPPWWRLASRWFREEGTGVGADYLARLQHGITIHVDTKLFGGVEAHLQFGNPTFDMVDDILERHIWDLESLRSSLVKQITVHPSQDRDLDEISEKTIPELEARLEAYTDAQVTSARTIEGLEHRKRSISQGELMMLSLETLVVNTFNLHFKEATKLEAQGQEIPIDLRRRVDFLGLLCFLASAQFRELELNKLELIEGSNVLAALKHHVSIQQTLEELISADLTLYEVAANTADWNQREGDLRSRVEKMKERCLRKKHELEFLGRQEKAQTDPSADRFGAKLSKAIKRLRHQLGRAFEEKALVFSSYTESLVQFARLLGLGYTPLQFVSGRGVTGVQQSGSFISRLQEFQANAEIRVLMLSALKQSTGLTLTNANHVFLFEDVEAGDEQQAIGRVRRIGQSRVTHVYKFRVLDPIESAHIQIPELSALREEFEAEEKERENQEAEETALNRFRLLMDGRQ